MFLYFKVVVSFAMFVIKQTSPTRHRTVVFTLLWRKGSKYVKCT